MHQIMISVHVPKTGGTSFRKMLEEFYGDGFQPDYHWEPRPSVMDGKELVGTDDEVREALCGVHCIHGHFNVAKYLRLLRVDGIEPVFITWLRDPIERAISTYHFLRTLETPPEDQPEWERQAKAMSLEQFYSETKFGRNRQFAQIRALDRDRFSFIGCTERYSESMSLFARMFFPDREPPTIPHELKNEARKGDKYDMPSSVRQLLTETNDLDFRLYEYGRGWLNGSMSAHM